MLQEFERIQVERQFFGPVSSVSVAFFVSRSPNEEILSRRTLKFRKNTFGQCSFRPSIAKTIAPGAAFSKICGNRFRFVDGVEAKFRKR